MLTAIEERALVVAAKSGDQRALNALIDAHRPMIRKIAMRQKGRLEEEDAVSEGIIGFLKAIPKFEVERGFRLNTYSRHYVGEAVRHAASHAPMVRFAQTESVRAGISAIRTLSRSGTVTPEAVAEKARISVIQATEVIAKNNHAMRGTAAIEEVLELGDDRPSAEQLLMVQSEREVLRRAATILNARELDIFLDRTAADDEPLTLDELAKRHGVSRERIRQIENRIVTKVTKEVANMRQRRQLRAA